MREAYVITPPDPTQYVPLSQVKQYLRLTDDDTSQDMVIQGHVTAAADYIAKMIRVPCLQTQYGLKLDGFYNSIEHAHNYMENLAYRFGFNIYGIPVVLPYAPLISVDQVQWIQQNGTVATLDPSTYVVDTYNLEPKFYPAFGQVWPIPQPIQNNVTITFTAGYAETPPGLQAAICVICDDWYWNRGTIVKDSTVNEVPAVLDRLLSPYKWGTIGAI